MCVHLDQLSSNTLRKDQVKSSPTVCTAAPLQPNIPPKKQKDIPLRRMSPEVNGQLVVLRCFEDRHHQMLHTFKAKIT